MAPHVGGAVVSAAVVPFDKDADLEEVSGNITKVNTVCGFARRDMSGTLDATKR